MEKDLEQLFKNYKQVFAENGINLNCTIGEFFQILHTPEVMQSVAKEKKLRLIRIFEFSIHLLPENETGHGC